MQNNIFHALHLCAFRVTANKREPYLKLIKDQLANAIRILFMAHELEKKNADKTVSGALYLELNKIRDSLLLLFSFIFDKDKMMKAKSAFVVNKKENVANALEIIELETPQDISLQFIRVFEPGNTADKCGQLFAYFTETLNFEGIMDDILNETHYGFHRWTKAAALYSLTDYKGGNKLKWMTKASHEPDVLLMEIGQKGLAELN
jgi:hypothetical protein